jgi:hypothetical protein
MINYILNLFPANPKHVMPWAAFFIIAALNCFFAISGSTKFKGGWLAIGIVLSIGFIAAVYRMYKQDQLRK